MKKKKKKKNILVSSVVVLVLIVLAIIIRVYIIKESPYLEYKEEAIEKCISLCQEVRKFDRMDSEGPCLDDNIVPNWGCDVVHTPRVALIDDANRNRCHGHKHLVEISFSCELVSAR